MKAGRKCDPIGVDRPILFPDFEMRVSETSDFFFFDLGNVLVRFSHQQACRQMADVAGCTPAEVWETVFSSPLQERYERGQISTDEFVARFSAATRSQPEPKRLIEAASDIFSANPGIDECVARLDDQGMPLGILSNTCAAHWDWIASRFEGLLERFAVKALSYELGVVKPEPAIYERAEHLAAKWLGRAPSRILFTDDRAEHVAGAQAAGWHTHHFTSVAGLANWLEDLPRTDSGRP